MVRLVLGELGELDEWGEFYEFKNFMNTCKTNVKKVCARRRLDGSRCFRFGLRIYNFFGLFPTAKI